LLYLVDHNVMIPVVSDWMPAVSAAAAYWAVHLPWDRQLTINSRFLH